MSELKTIGNELLTADLKARIAELEELQFEQLVSGERIKVLEAENAELKRQLSPLSSATPSYVAGLEAELDKLRARHAALVEAARPMLLELEHFLKGRRQGRPGNNFL